MENISTGSAALDSMDTYKLALPSSLQPNAPLNSITFCSTSSRPNAFPGLSKGDCRELLRLLIATIRSNFMACADPEILLARIDQALGNKTLSEIREQKVVLAGASNLKYCLPHFQQEGMCFVDQCEPGWTASANKVVVLKEKIKRHVADGATAFVFDILSNTAVRFEQYDGSTSLPYKSGGRFHLGGKVVTSPQEIFTKTLEAIMPILQEAKGLPCIILPPLPRYLYARCCEDDGHCTNFGKPEFEQSLLAGYIQLRNWMIRTLVQRGLKNFKVMDTCCATSCKNTANIQDRLKLLRGVTAKDSVHFVSGGYANMAARTLVCLAAMLDSPQKSQNPSTHFWRGFKSVRGSQTGKLGFADNQRKNSSRGGHFRKGAHPYQRY
jgi:hypothetical protein